MFRVEPPGIDPEFLDLVLYDAFCCPKYPGSLALVTPTFLQGVYNHSSFLGFNQY